MACAVFDDAPCSNACWISRPPSQCRQCSGSSLTALFAGLRAWVEQVRFGGAAGTLASLGDQGIAVMEALATELRLSAPAARWHVNRENFAETVAFLGLVCASLAKFATDIIRLTQTEAGEASED